jgi:hypothetical protein
MMRDLLKYLQDAKHFAGAFRPEFAGVGASREHVPGTRGMPAE